MAPALQTSYIHRHHAGPAWRAATSSTPNRPICSIMVFASIRYFYLLWTREEHEQQKQEYYVYFFQTKRVWMGSNVFIRSHSKSSEHRHAFTATRRKKKVLSQAYVRCVSCGIYYMAKGRECVCRTRAWGAISRTCQVDWQKCVDFSIESEKLDDFVGRCRKDSSSASTEHIRHIANWSNLWLYMIVKCFSCAFWGHATYTY